MVRVIITFTLYAVNLKKESYFCKVIVFVYVKSQSVNRSCGVKNTISPFYM